MEGWFSPLFGRKHTPIEPVDFTTFSAIDSYRREAIASKHKITPRRRPFWLGSPSLQDPSKFPDPPKAPPVVPPDILYYKPSTDHMVDSLKVIMMHQNTMDQLPVQYNPCLLHVLEAYQDMKLQLQEKTKELEELQRIHTIDINDFDEMTKGWCRKEEEFQKELKRLEVILSKTEGGLEAVALARTHSVIHGSRKASESISKGMGTIRARNSHKGQRETAAASTTATGSSQESNPAQFETLSPFRTRRGLRPITPLKASAQATATGRSEGSDPILFDPSSPFKTRHGLRPGTPLQTSAQATDTSAQATDKASVMTSSSSSSSAYTQSTGAAPKSHNSESWSLPAWARAIGNRNPERRRGKKEPRSSHGTPTGSSESHIHISMTESLAPNSSVHGLPIYLQDKPLPDIPTRVSARARPVTQRGQSFTQNDTYSDTPAGVSVRARPPTQRGQSLTQNDPHFDIPAGVSVRAKPVTQRGQSFTQNDTYSDIPAGVSVRARQRGQLLTQNDPHTDTPAGLSVRATQRGQSLTHNDPHSDIPAGVSTRARPVTQRGQSFTQNDTQSDTPPPHLPVSPEKRFSFLPGDDLNVLSPRRKEEGESEKSARKQSDTKPTKPKTSAAVKSPHIPREFRDVYDSLSRDNSNSSIVTAVRVNSGRSTMSNAQQENKQVSKQVSKQKSDRGIGNTIGSTVAAAAKALAKGGKNSSGESATTTPGSHEGKAAETEAQAIKEKSSSGPSSILRKFASHQELRGGKGS